MLGNVRAEGQDSENAEVTHPAAKRAIDDGANAGGENGKEGERVAKRARPKESDAHALPGANMGTNADASAASQVASFLSRKRLLTVGDVPVWKVATAGVWLVSPEAGALAFFDLNVPRKGRSTCFFPARTLKALLSSTVLTNVES